MATSLDEITPRPPSRHSPLRGHYRVNEHLRLNMALENLLNTSYCEPGSLAIINPQGIPAFLREPGFGRDIFGIDARF